MHDKGKGLAVCAGPFPLPKDHVKFDSYSQNCL